MIPNKLARFCGFGVVGGVWWGFWGFCGGFYFVRLCVFCSFWAIFSLGRAQKLRACACVIPCVRLGVRQRACLGAPGRAYGAPVGVCA